MNNDITRYIQYVEVSNGDACIVLDDGSILGGVYSVSTSSTAGTAIAMVTKLEKHLGMANRK